MMKKIFTFLLAMLGLTTACGQQPATDTYEVDEFTTKSGKTVKFHALVHASIRIEYDGKEIEIDPVTKLGNKVINYAAMPKADYLFVTHEHGDHFDKEAIKLLSGATTRFVTNQRCADMYGSGEVMANGDKLQIAEGFTVEGKLYGIPVFLCGNFLIYDQGCEAVATAEHITDLTDASGILVVNSEDPVNRPQYVSEVIADETGEANPSADDGAEDMMRLIDRLAIDAHKHDNDTQVATAYDSGVGQGYIGFNECCYKQKDNRKTKENKRLF